MRGKLCKAKLLVDAGNDHVRLLWIVLQVVGGGFFGEARGRLGGGGQLVSANLVVAMTNDTVHLADKKSLALDFLDLTETSLGDDVSVDLGLVFSEEPIDGARAVGDVEVLAISTVSSGVACVALRVGEAGDRVDPEVGTATFLGCRKYCEQLAAQGKSPRGVSKGTATGALDS